MNALPYQDRTGCQWELLPRDLLPRRIAQDDHADQKFENARLKGWLAARGDPFRRELVRRPEGSGGFVKRRLAADDKRPIG